MSSEIVMKMEIIASEASKNFQNSAENLVKMAETGSS